MPLDGKVMPSAKVSRPTGDLGSYPPLNPESGRNPSMANNNSPPTVPASHAQSGMANPGTNGPKAPEWEMRQK